MDSKEALEHITKAVKKSVLPLEGEPISHISVANAMQIVTVAVASVEVKDKKIKKLEEEEQTRKKEVEKFKKDIEEYKKNIEELEISNEEFKKELHGLKEQCEVFCAEVDTVFKKR